MTALSVTLNPQDIISVTSDQVRTTALKVAEAFGKLHKDVVRKVESLDCSDEFNQRNFTRIPVSVDLGQGRTREGFTYEITKDGFMFLVMGFTGKKAAAIKEQYINAFNWMAEQLKGKQSLLADLPLVTYWDHPVVTFEMVDKVHGRKVGHANRRFYDDSARFVVGVDYFKVPWHERDVFKKMGVNVHRKGLIVLTESGYLKLTQRFAESGAEYTRRQMCELYFSVPRGAVSESELNVLRQAFELCAKWLTIQKFSPSDEQKVIDIFAWRLDMADFARRLEVGDAPDGQLSIGEAGKLKEAAQLLADRVALEHDRQRPHDEYVKGCLSCAASEAAWAERWSVI